MPVFTTPHDEPVRIVEEVDPHGVVVAIHGWLTEPAVGELVRIIASRGKPGLRIDLTNLVGADHAGLAALRRMRADGMPLIGGSPYIELLLESAPAT